MKKALSFFSIIVGSVMLVQAQAQVVIGQTAAQGQVNGTALVNLIGLAQTIVTRLVPLAVGLAVISFFWYLIQFIWKGGESGEKKEVSLKGMGYSILAIFVMVSIWGLVGLLGSLTGVGQGGKVPVPEIPVPTS